MQKTAILKVLMEIVLLKIIAEEGTIATV